VGEQVERVKLTLIELVILLELEKFVLKDAELLLFLVFEDVVHPLTLLGIFVVQEHRLGHFGVDLGSLAHSVLLLA